MKWHLAQVNVATAKYHDDDPEFSGFVDNLDRINALADESQGFVWRYVSTDDDAEARRVFGDNALLFNMSLWRSLADLRRFVYESDHLNILRQRAKWFVPQDRPVLALWWQAAGEIPDVVESKHRLDCLAERGPTAEAFTFRNAFDAPDSRD